MPINDGMGLLWQLKIKLKVKKINTCDIVFLLFFWILQSKENIEYSSSNDAVIIQLMSQLENLHSAVKSIYLYSAKF